MIYVESCSLWLLILTGLFNFALGQSSTSATPASIPLVLRSPYFNAWIPTLPEGGGADIGGVQLWNTQTVGWVGFIRIDGEMYGWLGVGGDDKVTVLGTSVTPTQTVLRLRTDPLDLTITFLSPVEPSDWTLQSLPFSYVAFDISSRDGSSHSVQIYTHVTGEWISSDLETSTRSTTTRGRSAMYHTTRRSNPSAWVEEDGIAHDAALVLAAASSNMLTTQTGHAAGLRGEFDRNGHLTNAVDSAHTPISPAYPAVALALDLGDVDNTPSPTSAVFALGIVRDPLINYGGSERRPYWTTRWNNLGDALGDFIADYPETLERARSFDDRLMSAARAAASTEYADLVALSVRQLFASIDITTGGDSSNVKAFMKDMGIGRRTNPLDTLYASFPALMYFNASLGGILLEPLLDLQDSSNYQHPYASPDLGSSYPMASANDSDTRALSVDSSASMLIMAWLYAQKSGDGLLIDRYYELLKKWADYLADNALRPSSFSSSDGLSGSTNSNLALKGILGIYAMGQISGALEKRGKDLSTQRYQDIARQYLSEWEGLAFSSGRVSSSYEDASSWALAYNLYPARLMASTEFVGMNVFDGQTSFYSSRLSSTGSNFGLGYDSNTEYIVKSHWTLFAAASATSDTVRDRLIRGVHARTFLEGRTPAFSTTYDLRSGGPPPETVPDGRASPAQGAMLSLLAMSLPNINVGFTGVAGGENGGKKANAGAIAGGVVGGLAVIAGLFLLAYFLHRCKQRKLTRDEGDSNPATTFAPLSGPSKSGTSSPLARLFRRRPETDSSRDLVASPFNPSPPSTMNEGVNLEPVTTRAIPAPVTLSEKRALQAEHAQQSLVSIPSSSNPRAGSLLASSARPSTGQSEGSGGSLSYTSPSSNAQSGQTAPAASYTIPSSSGGNAPVVKNRYMPANPSPSTPTSPGSPPTPAGGPPGLPSSDTDSLRAEVVELRRQMAQIQARTMLQDDRSQYSGHDEPPPSYS